MLEALKNLPLKNYDPTRYFLGNMIRNLIKCSEIYQHYMPRNDLFDNFISFLGTKEQELFLTIENSYQKEDIKEIGDKLTEAQKQDLARRQEHIRAFQKQLNDQE